MPTRQHCGGRGAGEPRPTSRVRGCVLVGNVPDDGALRVLVGAQREGNRFPVRHLLLDRCRGRGARPLPRQRDLPHGRSLVGVQPPLARRGRGRGRGRDARPAAYLPGVGRVRRRAVRSALGRRCLRWRSRSRTHRAGVGVGVARQTTPQRSPPTHPPTHPHAPENNCAASLQVQAWVRTAYTESCRSTGGGLPSGSSPPRLYSRLRTRALTSGSGSGFELARASTPWPCACTCARNGLSSIAMVMPWPKLRSPAPNVGVVAAAAVLSLAYLTRVVHMW